MGPQARLHFSNALGTRPVTLDGVFAGMQQSGSVLEPGSNQPVNFGGKPAVTIAPGQSVWSDPVGLPFVQGPADPALVGNRMAVSLHVAGESGPITWHAKALTTSYLTPPGSGSKGNTDGVLDFPFSTASTLNGDDRWPDVLSLSGVTSLIWLEGINDFSKNGNATSDAVIAGMKQGVSRIRAKFPGVTIIGAPAPPQSYTPYDG